MAEVTCHYKLAKELHGPAYEFNSFVSRLRSNVKAPSYTRRLLFRKTLYNDFIFHVVRELEDRFIITPPHGINLLQLLPSECCKLQLFRKKFLRLFASMMPVTSCESEGSSSQTIRHDIPAIKWSYSLVKINQASVNI